jgi:hypothetical protein
MDRRLFMQFGLNKMRRKIGICNIKKLKMEVSLKYVSGVGSN